MRALFWTLGWIAVAVWTIFVLAGMGILGFVGDVARDVSGHVQGFPDEFLSMPWLVALVQRAGSVALLLIWLAGAGLILAVPAIINLFLPRSERALRRLRAGRADYAAPAPVNRPAPPPAHPLSQAARRQQGRDGV